MKWKAACLLLLLALGGYLLMATTRMPETSGPMDVRVMTFNIRQGRANDGENCWESRKDLVCDAIRDETPDIVGMQEAYRFQLDHIRERLPEFGEVGIGRDGGEEGEYSCILYRRERFDVIESNTFWLSDTPQKPSADWGNQYRRICTWARLVDKQTGRSLHVYNTHMDHQSQMARENGARLIMKTIAMRETPGPFILTGDLNANEDNDVVAYLKGAGKDESANPIALVDSWREIHPAETLCGTVSRFNGCMDKLKIDYILVTPDTQVLEAAILRVNRDGRYPSDHYPVTARLRF